MCPHTAGQMFEQVHYNLSYSSSQCAATCAATHKKQVMASLITCLSAASSERDEYIHQGSFSIIQVEFSRG